MAPRTHIPTPIAFSMKSASESPHNRIPPPAPGVLSTRLIPDFTKIMPKSGKANSDTTVSNSVEVEKHLNKLRKLNLRLAELDMVIATLERLRSLRENRSWGTSTQLPGTVVFQVLTARRMRRHSAKLSFRCRPVSADKTRVSGSLEASQVA